MATLSPKNLKTCLNLAICFKKKSYFRKFLEAVSPFDNFDNFSKKNKTLMVTTMCSQFSTWIIYDPYRYHLKGI